MSQAKHVVVVGTGGTIASRYDPAARDRVRELFNTFAP